MYIHIYYIIYIIIYTLIAHQRYSSVITAIHCKKIVKITNLMVSTVARIEPLVEYIHLIYTLYIIVESL